MPHPGGVSFDMPNGVIQGALTTVQYAVAESRRDFLAIRNRVVLGRKVVKYDDRLP